MTVTKTQEGAKLTLAVEGRVDTNTSMALQNEVLAAFKDCKTLILDLAQVQYVSSAGLRVLLIGQKAAAAQKKELRLINVTQPVQAVLRSVGFNKVLNIK